MQTWKATPDGTNRGIELSEGPHGLGVYLGAPAAEQSAAFVRIDELHRPEVIGRVVADAMLRREGQFHVITEDTVHGPDTTSLLVEFDGMAMPGAMVRIKLPDERDVAADVVAKGQGDSGIWNHILHQLIEGAAIFVEPPDERQDGLVLVNTGAFLTRVSLGDVQRAVVDKKGRMEAKQRLHAAQQGPAGSRSSEHEANLAEIRRRTPAAVALRLAQGEELSPLRPPRHGSK
jgi:hypothetical protein